MLYFGVRGPRSGPAGLSLIEKQNRRIRSQELSQPIEESDGVLPMKSEWRAFCALALVTSLLVTACGEPQQTEDPGGSLPAGGDRHFSAECVLSHEGLSVSQDDFSFNG